jgi:branched-chain amino acid transport system permease protein
VISAVFKRHFSSKTTIVNTVIVVVAVLWAFVFPLVSDGPLIGVGLVALIYAMRNFTWNIAGGFTGAISLAHVGAFGIGAFSVAILTWTYGWNVWLSIAFGIGLSAVLGVVVSLVMTRLGVNALFFTLGTLALSMALAALAASWSVTGGVDGLQNLTSEEGLLYLQWFSDSAPLYYVTLVILIVIVIGTAFIVKRTKFGRSLPFIREDPQMAASMGINVVRNQAAAMGLSMGLTAIPGSLMVLYTNFVSYESVLTLEVGISMIVGAIIGGSTTLAGPIVAGVGIAALDEGLRAFDASSSAVSSFTQILYAVIVIVLIKFGSAGLVPLWNSLLRRLFREDWNSAVGTVEDEQPPEESGQRPGKRKDEARA